MWSPTTRSGLADSQLPEQIWPLLPAGSRVEHVGSTAVPGLAAQDIIDIAVVVPSLDDLDPVIDRLEAISYQARQAAFDADPGHVFSASWTMVDAPSMSTSTLMATPS